MNELPVSKWFQLYNGGFIFFVACLQHLQTLCLACNSGIRNLEQGVRSKGMLPYTYYMELSGYVLIKLGYDHLLRRYKLFELPVVVWVFLTVLVYP